MVVDDKDVGVRFASILTTDGNVPIATTHFPVYIVPFIDTPGSAFLLQDPQCLESTQSNKLTIAFNAYKGVKIMQDDFLSLDSAEYIPLFLNIDSQEPIAKCVLHYSHWDLATNELSRRNTSLSLRLDDHLGQSLLFLPDSTSTIVVDLTYGAQLRCDGIDAKTIPSTFAIRPSFSFILKGEKNIPLVKTSTNPIFCRVQPGLFQSTPLVEYTKIT